MKKIGVIVALFLAVAAVPGWTMCPADQWLEDTANSGSYPVKAGGMILRGVHRIIESPVEIACHTYKGATEELEYGLGIFKGLGMGLLWTLDSAVRGAWDIVTFAFPDYHGEPGKHEQECWGAHAGGGKAKA